MPNFSGPYPYSAPRPRSLPTYDPTQDDATVFANWNSQLANSVQNAAPQATPLNFAVTNGTNQLTLNWGAVSGSDGYEILKSPSGSFSTDLQIIPVKNANQTSYVDNTVTGGAQCFYRIRTTSGTKQNPQSQRGPESGVVSHTAISSTSSQTATTILDQFTTDSSRAGARKGNYGAFKQANTGTLTRVTGAGQKSGAASGASGPAAGTKSSGMKSIASAPTSSNSSGGGSGGGGSSPSSTPFSSISSGVNNTAVMQVGNGGQIIPNDANPGIIEATEAPWSGLFGDLLAGQYIPFDNTATVGTPATTISQVVNGVLGIGTGVAPATSTSGALVLTTATVLGSGYVSNLVSPAATITTLTAATATIATMINTAATITTATVQTLVVATTATVSGLAISGQVVENGVRTSGAGLVPIVYAIKSVTATGSQANSTTLPVGGIYEAIGFFGHITNTTLTLGNATVSWYDGGSGSLMVASPQLLLVSSGAVVSTIATTNTTGSGTAYFTPIAFNATATTFAWGIVCNTSVGVYEYALVVKQLF